MAEVVRFPDPAVVAPVRIRECRCGWQHFFLYEDGQVQCAACDLMHDEVAGKWTILDADSR